MSTPRAFQIAAGDAVTSLAFVGCELMRATSAGAQAQTPASAPTQSQAPAQAQTTARAAAQATARSRRREVVVNGKRVKTVDVHAHCSVPEAMALMSAPLPGPPLLLFTKVEDRVQAMDAQGIDVEALSINPFWYKAERDLAAPTILVL